MKNLFIEGMPGIGKSTALLEALSNVLTKAAGFKTARVYRSNGEKFGYAEFSADSDNIGVNCISDIVLETQFIVFNEKAMPEVRNDVFIRNAEEFLIHGAEECKAGKKSFILMDEIGGNELDIDEYCEILFNVFESDIPCIGIIKHPEHAKRLINGPFKNEKAYVRYLELYRYLSVESDTLILTVTENSVVKIKDAVDKWCAENGI